MSKHSLPNENNFQAEGKIKRLDRLHEKAWKKMEIWNTL